MKYYIILLLLSVSLTSFAQQINKDGKTYEVKKDKIFLENEDVTATLKPELIISLLKQAADINEKLALEKLTKTQAEKAAELEKIALEAQKAQDEAAVAETELKKAQNELKKAEKEADRKAKLQSNFTKAESNLDKAEQKYQKLKNKGKLSPIDEGKWLEKIEKLSKKLNKIRSKM